MRKSMLYRLSLGSRWYFYLNNFGIFARTGRCGRRGRLDKERQIYFSNKNFRLVEKCGGRIHLRGLENLRDVSGEPVVLIGNHMSLLETALFHAVAREYLDFTFVIKQSLLTVPFFRDIMRSLGAIPVGRENPRDDLRAVLGDGKKVLESGRSIIIFPQSTRSETFDAAKFNSIGIKLAKTAGVRVLPFALKTDFLGNGKYLRDMGPVRPKRGVYFEFAPARAVEGNGQALQQEIIGFIQSRLASWQAMDSEQ
ncbi:1-acyl-sn-glycerol-3-phosphate acyltransferase [bacterium]|nr:1-acyl-sn-glycerol-3-phosphate acyltransferase [bacterium]